MSDATLLPAIAMAAGLAAALGTVLGLVAARLQPRPDSLVERIDALLPQTQCAQCRYPGCRPYAEAIARGEADIDRCPPGGEATVRALAELLDRELRPVDPRYGPTRPPLVALIDEGRAIGSHEYVLAMQLGRACVAAIDSPTSWSFVVVRGTTFPLAATSGRSGSASGQCTSAK